MCVCVCVWSYLQRTDLHLFLLSSVFIGTYQGDSFVQFTTQRRLVKEPIMNFYDVCE